MSATETLDQTGAAMLETLKALIAAGEFHHATYRERGTIWEGLWIYKRAQTGRGFTPVGCIPGRVGAEFCGGTRETNRSVLDEAYKLIGGARISVGAYGEG